MRSALEPRAWSLFGTGTEADGRCNSVQHKSVCKVALGLKPGDDSVEASEVHVAGPRREAPCLRRTTKSRNRDFVGSVVLLLNSANPMPDRGRIHSRSAGGSDAVRHRRRWQLRLRRRQAIDQKGGNA